MLNHKHYVISFYDVHHRHFSSNPDVPTSIFNLWSLIQHDMNEKA